MVLVLLKNWLAGSSTSDKKALLPVTRSYDTLNQTADEPPRRIRRIRSTSSSASSSDSLDEEYETESNGSTSTLAEGSFVAPRVLSDVIIGLSDGLTVPFALTAGLSSLGDSKLVITGGLAELVSGAISMGLGGYLAAVGESEYYNAQLEKERQAYEASPYSTIDTLQSILAEFKLSETTIGSFTADLQKSPDELIQFVIRVGKGLEEPADSRQFTSALTIGISYFVGGFVPLIPYFFASTVETGLYISALVMAITLFLFGSTKTVVSIGTDAASPGKIIQDGVKMMLIGGVAAGCAWALVKAIE